MARQRYIGQATLSKKQAEVASLVSRGMSNKEVARALGVAPETVKSHLRTIYIKFGIKSRAGVHEVSEIPLMPPPLVREAIKLCESKFVLSGKSQTEQEVKAFAREIWELLTRSWMS